MKLRVIVASLFVAGSVYAQAPGADPSTPGYYDEDAQPTGGPGMAPVVAPVVVVAPERPRRWSVGLGIGSMGLTPHHQPDNETQFSLGMIALRFRPWQHLEFELALSGGGENVEEGEGYREVSQGVLGLRYRFNPARKWNLWVMAGMGSLTVSNKDASKEERDAAQQSTLQFGAGLERRWTRFALQLELRMVGVAPVDHGDEPPQVMPDIKVGTTTMPPPPPGTTTGDGWKGGQMILSGNYYF